MATVREKIDFLASIKTQKDYFRLSKNVRCIAFDIASGRTYQYINLRRVLSKKMDDEKVSRKEMARAIGIRSSSLTDYLSGRRGLPYPYVERILGILFGDSYFVDKFVGQKGDRNGQKDRESDPSDTTR